MVRSVKKRCESVDYKIILDTIIILLLIATIGYAVALNHQLRVLRRDSDELARLVSTFNEATMRAEGGVLKLRKMVEKTGEELQEQVDKATVLRDDLAFMIERADAAADRLDRTMAGSSRNERLSGSVGGSSPVFNPDFRTPRAADAPAGALRSLVEGATAVRADAVADDDRSEAERDLLRVLQSIR